MIDAGGGLYVYESSGFTPGTHWWKAVITGTWDSIGWDSRSVNTADMPFEVASETDIVSLYVTPDEGTIRVAVETGGACCSIGGTCHHALPGVCADWGGVYQGDNVPCSPGLCPPGGDIIFDNFSPDGEYVEGWTSVSLYINPLGGEEMDVDSGMAFTPSDGDYTLTALVLGVVLQLGGANELDVWLMSDDNGVPDSVIGAMHLSGAVVTWPTLLPPAVAVSQTHPLLLQGQRYWVALSATGPPDVQFMWMDNSVGYQGLGAQRVRTDGVGDWAPIEIMNCTFRVVGEAVPRLGDCDGDQDVDATDYHTFAGCMSGPGGGLGPDCACADLDYDGDVDLKDFALFQQGFTGPSS
jgi:hypothetical protein